MRNGNNRFSRSIAPRSLIAVLSLVAATMGRAQNITVTAANASNDAVYNVVFNTSGGGTTTVLNTDGGALHNLVSLVFLPNPSTMQLDLLAADNQGGLIVRYPGDFGPGTPTTGTVVFSAAGGVGPANPDGLSVDGAGNLFIINSKPGTTSQPQLWVLPTLATGGFGSAVLIDAHFPASETLQETLIAGTAIIPPGAPPGTPPVVNPGDLLVLTSNPSTVQKYSSTTGNGPVGAATPTTLLTLPPGTIPGGLAIWPADNTLLITTSRGTILQYRLTPNETPGMFASGLGNGQFKIKTGIQFGVPFAYVANNNGGDILQFGGPNNLLATVTTRVQHPQGLAVTNAAYAPLTACQDQQTNGCDLFGRKVITHEVPSTLSLAGNILEDVCVVRMDPRLVQASSCTTALPVSTVCPGYSDTVVIPASLCGSSGPTGKGFALVKSLTAAYLTPSSFPYNGSLISNDANLPNILPAPGNPVCNPPAPGITPLGTFAWAPLAGEGVVAEGNDLLEITGGCDGSTSRSYGLSLFGIGLGLNTAATGDLPSFLVSFTKTKYIQRAQHDPG